MAAATAATLNIEKQLWISRSGHPMSSRAIHEQITSRTKRAFGNAIWPHLFRDCAVTELVDCALEEIGIAPDLLGHADLQTTRKHYIKAHGMTAHRRVQELISARRRAASGRRDAVHDHAAGVRARESDLATVSGSCT
jgi:integrase/recombinase XerD